MTKHEKLIFELVSASREHPTAEDVFHLARTQAPSIAMATVYNNLNKLVDGGMLRRISTPIGADRYDRTERHDHMVCVDCGNIRDLMLADFTKAYEREVGEQIISYDLMLRYRCGKCEKNSYFARKKEEKAL